MTKRPTDQSTNPVAQAFTRKSVMYDAFGHNHENLTRMRNKVYDHISAFHKPDSYLLELNAGTGLDASQMVARGYRVHATDLSSGMVAQAKEKVVRLGLQDRLTVQQCSFTELDYVTAGPFDGIYSNFGGLNCIADLTAVTRHLPSLLKPGGIVSWVIMPPTCPWELSLILKDARAATRRLRPGGIIANVEGVQFKTHYFSVNQVRHAFNPHFQQVRLEALSLLTPTADNKTFAQNHPKLFNTLVKLDDTLSQWPLLNHWGDFFILSMRLQ